MRDPPRATALAALLVAFPIVPPTRGSAVILPCVRGIIMRIFPRSVVSYPIFDLKAASTGYNFLASCKRCDCWRGPPLARRVAQCVARSAAQGDAMSQYSKLCARVRRRDLLKTAATATVAAGLDSLFPRPVSAQAVVKIGTAVLGDYALAGPILVALEKGFFKERGINVELVPFRGGPNLVKAVVSGEILIGLSGSTDVPLFREAGFPIKAIATYTEGNHFTLNTAPTITKLADLKGKRIGVTSLYATTWIFAMMLAKQQGLDPERDLKLVALGGLDAQMASMARGEIDAFVWGDYGAALERAGTSKVLLRFDKVTPRWISQVAYASDQAIQTQPDAIRRSLQGLFQAIHFMKARPEETAQLVSKKLGWSVEAVRAAHNLSSPLFPSTGRVSPEALSTIQSTLIEIGVMKKRVRVDDLYTNQFTPVAVRPGGCPEGRPC